MSAENEEQPSPPPHKARFDTEDMKRRAKQAQAKTEFILSRAYGLFRKPGEEWEQIRREETNVPSLLAGYVAPLAAIPPVCDLIGSALFRRAAIANVADSAVAAVVTWGVSILVVFLLGILINVMAENFDADRNDVMAQKVSAYAMTPAFLSGLFSLFPDLWWFSLFAVAYSAYLLYRGLTPLMKAPEERALSYASTIGIAGLVSFIVLFALASCVN